MHINAQTAEEAMEQYDCIHHDFVRIAIYADCDMMFLDAEGSAELCRLLHIKKTIDGIEGHIVPVLPCDYSICMLASQLQIDHIEIMMGNPILEEGIVRPSIVHRIMQDINVKMIAGGNLCEQDIEMLRLWGCVGVRQYVRSVS